VGVLDGKRRAFHAMKKWDGLEAVSAQIAKLEPSRHDALFTRAEALVRLGRLEEAAVAEDAFLAAQPHSYDGLELRRETMKALHRWSDLAATCDAILEVQPRDAAVLKDLGVAHLSTGAFREALTAYEGALASASNDLEAWWGKRDALEGLKDSRQLVRACDSILAADPRDVATWRAKGRAHEALEQPDDAL